MLLKILNVRKIVRLEYCRGTGVIFLRNNYRTMADQAIENFREYLRIKTVQPNPDYDSAVVFLKKMASQLQLKFQTHEFVAKKPVVILTWPGSDTALPSLLLNSHMDVVPVFPEFWKCDPFEAMMDEKGDIYARGAQDMKYVGIQYLEAIRKLKADGFHPTRTVHLTFVPDEEIGGIDGMKVFAPTETFKSLNVGFSLDEGVTIICSGQPGHGSLFVENNAGENLRKVINSFLGYRDSEETRLLKRSSTQIANKIGDIIPPCRTPELIVKLLEKMKSDNLKLGDVTTVNLTKIQGGVQTNVVPSEFRATFDIRITPYVNMEDFEQKIKNWCETAGPGVTYEFEQRNNSPPLTSTSDDSVWWRTFKQIFTDLNLEMNLQIFPAATDSRYIRELGIPAIGFSPMNNTPVLLHDHNEFLNKDTFLKGIDIYVTMISRLANVKP